MPNTTLIEQLDSLRELYTQQQKTSVALQTAFKAITSAQSKAQKTLRDYRAQNTSVDVTGAESAFADLRLKENTIDPLLPDLRREVKILASLTGALRDAATALRTEPVDVARLDKAIGALQAAKQQNILDLLPELREELNLAQLALGDEFGYKLREALAQRNIQIGGRVPKFEIGRFEADANFAKRFLVLRYGKDIVAPHVSITVDAVMNAYDSAAKNISGRNQDGKTWMAQFYEAYQNVRRKRGADSGRVNIVDCYVELVLLRQNRAFISEPSKRTFTDYSRAQFIYDFYEFTNQQRIAHNEQVVKAHAATKSQTDNPAKSMWIVEGDSPYDGRFIADIEFTKD